MCSCQASFLPACLEVDVRHTLQHKHHSPRLGLVFQGRAHCMGHNLCCPGLPFCENKPEALFVHCALPRRQFGRCNTVKSQCQQGYCWHAGQMPGLIGNTKSPHDSESAENQCLPWKVCLEAVTIKSQGGLSPLSAYRPSGCVEATCI